MWQRSNDKLSNYCLSSVLDDKNPLVDWKGCGRVEGGKMGYCWASLFKSRMSAEGISCLYSTKNVCTTGPVWCWCTHCSLLEQGWYFGRGITAKQNLPRMLKIRSLQIVSTWTETHYTASHTKCGMGHLYHQSWGDRVTEELRTKRLSADWQKPLRISPFLTALPCAPFKPNSND